ncbi:MAG: cytochrome B [Candidatus Cyclobacteriaceae bacterium M3_2C_046]
MYNIILNIHSILRWVLLLLLLITILKSLAGWLGNHTYKPMDNKLGLLSLIFTHTQLIFGLILYFISPIVATGLNDMGNAMKLPEIRFWTVEHIAGMLIAIALITIGRISSKKKSASRSKHKTVFIYFLIATIIMIAMIPWDRFEGV